MRSPLPRAVVVLFVHLATLVTPVIAAAQQIPTPGVTPEEVKEWTWYLSWPIALAAILLALGFMVMYLRFSRRFFSMGEAPPLSQSRPPPRPARRPKRHPGPRPRHHPGPRPRRHPRRRPLRLPRPARLPSTSSRIRRCTSGSWRSSSRRAPT